MITVPKTVVLSTDVFDEFMEMNDLYRIGISDLRDEEILDHFVACQAAGLAAPGPLHGDFGVPGTHCRSLLQQTGRFTLPAFCGDLLHLYDPGEQGGSSPDHGAAHQCHQIGLCFGLFQGEQGLYRGHFQCDRRGEDGHCDPGGLRYHVTATIIIPPFRGWPVPSISIPLPPRSRRMELPRWPTDWGSTLWMAG